MRKYNKLQMRIAVISHHDHPIKSWQETCDTSDAFSTKDALLPMPLVQGLKAPNWDGDHTTQQTENAANKNNTHQLSNCCGQHGTNSSPSAKCSNWPVSKTEMNWLNRITPVSLPQGSQRQQHEALEAQCELTSYSLWLWLEKRHCPWSSWVAEHVHQQGSSSRFPSIQFPAIWLTPLLPYISKSEWTVEQRYMEMTRR